MTVDDLGVALATVVASYFLSRLPRSRFRLARTSPSSQFPEMPDRGLTAVKRAELVAHVAELDQMIEEQTAHLAVVAEMGLFLPIIEVRLERLKESRRLYLSALKHLLGDDEDTGSSR